MYCRRLIWRSLALLKLATDMESEYLSSFNELFVSTDSASIKIEFENSQVEYSWSESMMIAWADVSWQPPIILKGDTVGNYIINLQLKRDISLCLQPRAVWTLEVFGAFWSRLECTGECSEGLWRSPKHLGALRSTLKPGTYALAN